MDVKSLALLLLCLLVIQQLQTEGRMSLNNSLAALCNCRGNSATRCSDNYQLKLCNNNSSGCTNGHKNLTIDWIKVCGHCIFLPQEASGPADCCDDKTNRTICEKQVDMFLNDYFGFITIPHTTKRVITTTVFAKQTVCRTVTLTVTSMVSPSCTHSVVTSATQQTRPLPPSVEDKMLGALFGLSLLLLVMVITGWVCTCWKMKKKQNEVKSTAQNRTADASTENEQKCFDNPTYAIGGTSTPQLLLHEPQEYEIPVMVHQKSFPPVRYTMSDSVIQNPTSQKSTESTESGQDYDKLNRGKDNGNIFSDKIKPKIQVCESNIDGQSR